MYTKNCPVCGGEQVYTKKSNCQQAKKHNRMCLSCKQKEVCSKPERREQMKRVMLEKVAGGWRSPVLGRKLSPEKRKQAIKNLKLANKAKVPQLSNYVYWSRKYGVEEADKRLAACKKKQSENFTGSGNPMYGKPAPSKSGKGWKGWYKKWFFRSLRELSYVIGYLEPNKIKWIPAEAKELRMSYLTPMGVERTYSADFLVNDNILVEIKPKRLHTTPLIKAKTAAAETFCKERGWTYLLTDVEIIPFEQMKLLHASGDLVFTELYEKIFREFDESKIKKQK